MSQSSKVLITGATGFVGSALVDKLHSAHYDIVAAVHSHSRKLEEASVKQFDVDMGAADIDWRNILSEIEVVIHTAARVHIMSDQAMDPLMEFRKVNVEGTLNLARQAADLGVKRFIFLSSIKVNGESTLAPINDCTNKGEKVSFSEMDEPQPQDSYALSKWEAEKGLLKIAADTDLEVVIIRPPLVYGPGVKANFARLMDLVNKNYPLPFARVHNKRSLLALDNLVDFIITCIDHPAAANQIFLLSDDEDLSSTELLCKIALVMGKKALLFPVPVWFMKLVATLLGKKEITDRFFGSLQVDSNKARTLLGWRPVISLDEQLRKTAQVFLLDKHAK